MPTTFPLSSNACEEATTFLPIPRLAVSAKYVVHPEHSEQNSAAPTVCGIAAILVMGSPAAAQLPELEDETSGLKRTSDTLHVARRCQVDERGT